MSIRCKVCNASIIVDACETRTNNCWECQTCGNLLDIKGNIISLEQ